MAEYRVIQKLDEKLMAGGIIGREYSADYRLVHSKLNSHFKKSGAILPEKVFESGEVILRKWLMVLCKKGASQEKLTSYLRCGLAHLSFDFIESSYRSIESEDLITRVLLSFKNRNFHKTYFKAAELQQKTKPAVKKAAKKKAEKKIRAEKKPLKKTVKKTAGKTVKKASKKSPVKALKRPGKAKPKKAAKKTTAAKALKRKTAKGKKGLLKKLLG
jgi:hypothetical protein